jgi:hypothetical protein
MGITAFTFQGDFLDEMRHSVSKAQFMSDPQGTRKKGGFLFI